MSVVGDFYDNTYDEWGRLERHRIEFEMTKRALNEFINSKSEILDVGGGPGRYSIYLSQKGYRVTLFDLSGEMVKQAVIHAEEAGAVLEKAMQGNVLELNKFNFGKQYDAVLCMGPLYHLLEEWERKEAIKQCLNKLKPGGIIVISFISAYAPIIDCLKKYPEDIISSKERLLYYLKDGRNVVNSGFTDAYFINPDDVEELMKVYNISKLKFFSTEGLGSLCERELSQLPENIFQEWIDLFYCISENNNILGSSEHLLYIGRKAQ